MDVYTKCSNYATDTCPCILAENGKCIECSMCRGEDFCTCSDTVSFCIQQELINHGGKAKQQHRSIRCEVRDVKEYGDVFRYVRISVPNASDFNKPGTYIFARVNENPFFDTPLSVLYEDNKDRTIGLIIQMVGIKTECFQSIGKGDSIFVRGPYYNGLQGRNAVARLHNSKAVVICRGIGLIPSLHVIDSLLRNHNTLDVYLDEGKYSETIRGFFQNLRKIHVNEVTLCDQNGDLTDSFCRIATEAVDDGVELIHLGLSDHLIKRAMECFERIDPHHRTAFSCINNSRMCCGEGICGACTKNIGADHTVHLCKEQLDPREYKKLL